jgi:parallel beta-helix repeat protein
MKSQFKHAGLVLLLLTALNSQLSTAHAQGSLTPPGAPAPTMKSLAQVEPRTAITSLPYTISQPGSYYVTTNLSGNITIAASGVTLDLMGFELVYDLGTGIYISGSRSNLVIRNGTVRGCGFYGVDAFDASNSRVERLNVLSSASSGIRAGTGNTVNDCVSQRNGTDGISTGLGSTISGCTALNNGFRGIFADTGSTVSGCSARGNSFDGIRVGSRSTVSGCSSANNSANGFTVGDGSTVIGCTASSNSVGISATSGCTIKDSTASVNFDDGIQVGSGFGGTTIRGCTARGNAGDGIEAYNACLVVDNLCDGNGAGNGLRAGIHVTGTANRIENNQSSSNGRGIGVDGTGNLIIRNSATHNTTNYVIAAFNNVGVTVIPPYSGAITGDTGGAGVGTTDSWANFSY